MTIRTFAIATVLTAASMTGFASPAQAACDGPACAVSVLCVDPDTCQCFYPSVLGTTYEIC